MVDKWKVEIDSYIPQILADEPNGNNAILLAALYALRDRLAVQGEITPPGAHDAAESQAARPQAIDYVPHSRVDELLQEKLNYFIEYSKQKGLEQTTGAELHGEYAQKTLERMLEIDLDIARALLQSADEEERKRIRDTYREMSKL